MAVKRDAAITPPMIPPTTAGVFNLREVGEGEEGCGPDGKDEGADLVGDSSKPGLWEKKGNEMNKQRAHRIRLVLHSDRGERTRREGG